MKLFLDSSAIIDFFSGDTLIRNRIHAADKICTSVVCAYEVLIGERYNELKGLKSSYDRVSRFFDEIETLPFSYLNSIKASELSAKLILKGKKVNGLDVMIAAQAIAENACLLTKDSDFKAIQRAAPELVLDR